MVVVDAVDDPVQPRPDALLRLEVEHQAVHPVLGQRPEEIAAEHEAHHLERAEVWFDNEITENAKPIDWILYHQRSQPVAGAKSRRFYTRLIDLSQTEEQLRAALSEDTAYKIRRARGHDKIICECCDARDTAVMNRFEEVYKLFAARKGLPPLNRALLESLAAAGALDVAAAKDAQGKVLVYHANYRDCRRATQLESPSLYRTFSDSAARNFCGRANRYLTWNNILRYKEQGLKAFDFGGWHLGSDPDMVNINDFKRGFGGTVVCEYQCEHILTLKARIVLGVAKLLNRCKAAQSGSHDPSVKRENKLRPVEVSVAMK